MKRLALVLILAAARRCCRAPRERPPARRSTAPRASSRSLDGTLLGFRTAVDKPVTVVDLRTGTPKWVLPAGLTGGDLLVHQDGRTLVWYDASRGTTALRRRAPGVEFTARRRLAGRHACRGARCHGRETRVAIVSRSAQKTIVVARQAVGVRRASRRQALPDQVPDAGGYQVRLFARRLRPARGEAAQGPARVRRRSGARRSRALSSATAATSSRSTSARTAARWCTCST